MKKFIFFAIFLTLAIGASGYGSYGSRIPNYAVYSCNTCHLNEDFLADFANAGHAWTQTLCDQDSDGDGWTNGEELLDPDFQWSEGDADPGDPGDVYNPDDDTSYPPAAIDNSSLGEVKAEFK